MRQRLLIIVNGGIVKRYGKCYTTLHSDTVLIYPKSWLLHRAGTFSGNPALRFAMTFASQAVAFLFYFLL